MRDPGIDPIVLFADLLSRPTRKPVPLTPEQIKRLGQEAERNEWNRAVEARKAAKKGSK